MGFERVTIFGCVEVLVDAPSGGTLQFLTDLPGNALAVRATGAIPATSGRHPFRLRLGGTVKGSLYQLAVTPTTTARVYGARIWARQLGPGGAAWAWYPVPIIETPNEWIPVKLPIEATPESWQPVKLPIEPTPDAWQAAKLPVEPTPDSWLEAKLPVKPTPPIPDWINVAVDE